MGDLAFHSHINDELYFFFVFFRVFFMFLLSVYDTLNNAIISVQ